MLLGYFTENAYDKLLNDVAANSDRYGSDEDWLPEYFGNTESYYKTSIVNVNKFTPYYAPGQKDDLQKSSEDLTNTRLLFDAFRNLTPIQASNKYLWTYLCHAIPEYRKYINNRWMQQKRENTIVTHYFVTDQKDSLRNDNALSRLWWYGYLTYDNQNSNPYELTEILLTNQTICTDFMDTLNRRNFSRAKGVLLALKEFKKVLNEKEGITDYFRECNKYLNHYAAVTVMEFLDSNEIQDLAYNFMVKLRNDILSGTGDPIGRKKRRLK